MGLKQLADRMRPHLPQALRSAGARALAWPEDRRFRQAARGYRIAGDYRRIYCFHVRKTGGTSLHRSFLSVGGGDGREVQERMLAALNTRILHDGYAFAAHNRTVLEAGDYFYGYSHRPWHELRLPEKTFRVTVLRDPVERVLSHYRMLIGLRERGGDPRLIAHEGRWLGDGIGDFLERAPRMHLLNQLYTFSERLDVGEAVDRLREVEFTFMTERYSEGIAALSRRIGHDLPEHRARAAPARVEATDEERGRVHEVVAPEYAMLERLGPVGA